MRGKLFFVGTGAFALGILFRTLYVVPKTLLALFVFLASLSLAWFAFQRSDRFLVLALILLLFSGGAFRAALVQRTLPPVFTQYVGTYLSFTGTIVADPSIRLKNQQVTVQINDRNHVTRILVFAPRGLTYTYGERVEISGLLSKPASFATEGGRSFDYAEYLEKSGIFLTMTGGTIQVEEYPQGFFTQCADALFAGKHVFVAGLRHALPDPYPALATGLLTGDQHQLDDTIIAMLSSSGLIWVFVLSGYHVVVLAEGVLWLTRKIPKQLSYVLALCTITAVIFATGASAPSLRGGAMAFLMLYAHAKDRTYDSLRALCVSVIAILLWNPLLLAYDTGFQLSLVVTPALIICSPLIQERLLWIHTTFFRDVIAVSIVAQLSILPLLLWQTGNIGVWAIPANVFVMPIVPFAMACTVVAGFAGMLPHAIAAPLAPLFGFPAHAVLWYLLAVAQISSALPFAGTILPAFPFIFVVFSYALLIFGIVWLQKHSLTTRPR